MGLVSGWYYYGAVLKNETNEAILTDSVNREKAKLDSIQNVRQDSILKIKRDSLEKKRRDSLEKAVRDSVIKATKIKNLPAKVKEKNKSKSHNGDELQLLDMNEVKKTGKSNE